MKIRLNEGKQNEKVLRISPKVIDGNNCKNVYHVEERPGLAFRLDGRRARRKPFVWLIGSVKRIGPRAWVARHYTGERVGGDIDRVVYGSMKRAATALAINHFGINAR